MTDPSAPLSPEDGTRPTPARADLSQALSELTAEDISLAERRHRLGRVARALAPAVGGVLRPRAAVSAIVDAVTDVAPRLPVRDRATLGQHFPGLSTDELADRLIRNAARTTAAIGAAGGGIAAIEWAAPPMLLTAPLVLAAETAAVVAVEIKLIGELHEVYGQPIRGNIATRGASLVQAWAHRRGVNPLVPGGVGVAAVLGTAARRELRDRLVRRYGRSLTSFGPLLTGAAVAGYLNRRATLAVGRQVRKDLSRRALTLPPGQ